MKVETNLTSRQPLIPVEYGTHMRACVVHAAVEEALQFDDFDIAFVHDRFPLAAIFIRKLLSLAEAKRNTNNTYIGTASKK
jgi:hypothetical protein